MSFNVSADAYDQYMGRFSKPLAVGFADLAGVRAGQRALDVGCGPGALTEELVARLGADAVSAIDPSPSFVEAAQARFPGVDVRSGGAEDLPFPAGTFDRALAQLVVHFMADPVAGLREMTRVVRADGLIAACVWDHGGGSGPLNLFWDAVHDLDPAVVDESDLAGSRAGQLSALCAEAGLAGIEESRLSVDVSFASFDEWWEPFTFGVGPAGAYVATLGDTDRQAVRERCEQRLPAATFTLTVAAWSVVAHPQG